MERLTDIVKTESGIAKVQQVNFITPSTYIIRMERPGMSFLAGQYVTVGLENDLEKREYSIYSGINEEFIEILVKIIDDGDVSKKLSKCKPGDHLKIEGPFGFFTIKDEHVKANRKYLFIASGTGISPFHSMIRSYPELDYHILHGVRYANEAYGKENYDPSAITVCATRDKSTDYHGRVTKYLTENDFDPANTIVYLCGNSEMIYDAFDILTAKGFNTDQLQTEVYF